MRIPVPTYAHGFLQAEGPECPFGLLFAPCRRAEVLSWGFAARYAALGSALDSTEELWHPSPMQSGGRQYAPQLTRPLRRPAARADVPLKEEAKPPISLVVVLGLRGKSPR